MNQERTATKQLDNVDHLVAAGELGPRRRVSGPAAVKYDDNTDRNTYNCYQQWLHRVTRLLWKRAACANELEAQVPWTQNQSIRIVYTVKQPK